MVKNFEKYTYESLEFEPEEEWEEEDTLSALDNKDIVDGEIYTVYHHRRSPGHIFYMIGRMIRKAEHISHDGRYIGKASFIVPSQKCYDKESIWCYKTENRFIRIANTNEKNWFLECEKRNKYVDNDLDNIISNDPYYFINESIEFEPEEEWEELEYIYIYDLDDLVIGNIYTVIDDFHKGEKWYMIGRMKTLTIEDGDEQYERGFATFITADKRFRNDMVWAYMGNKNNSFTKSRKIRLSTPEEKKWFLKCEKEGRFIQRDIKVLTQDELNESFKPEEIWEEDENPKNMNKREKVEYIKNYFKGDIYM